MNAVILAAGESRRFGSNKLIVKYKSQPIIRTLYDIYSSCRFIRRIIVVTGHQPNAEQIIENLPESEKILFIRNTNYKAGMFTSVMAGIKAVENSVPGFFITPADVPFVKKQTVELLYNKFINLNKHENKVVIPSYKIQNKFRSGHPVIFGKNHVEKIINEPADITLRDYINKQKRNNNVYYQMTEDADILKDIDYKKDMMMKT